MSNSARLCGIVSLAILALGASPSWARKHDFAEGYKNRYFVVLHEGLPLGVCGQTSNLSPMNYRVEVDFPPADAKDGVSAQDSLKAAEIEANLHNLVRSPDVYDVDTDCGPVPEPIHKGEILHSEKARVHGKWLEIWVAALSYHSITRGVGAFQHESKEIPNAILVFPLDQSKVLIDQWFETYGTMEDANNSSNARPSNTASGVSVKEIKLGMTPAEVEAVMGPPVTRVDLGAKVLYKYKDMTVEFKDGKVTDVR
jgi:hypothetical protein